ncbi:thrombospondin-like domain-containing protein [uncultured Mediterranean phage]|nr:thrombospondin-like domain-containing protein [uncultured Mediterranean phage]
MPRRRGPTKTVQDLQFPTGGLVETTAFEDQPPNTTVDCENVRAFPANLTVSKAAGLNATTDGRNRGGQRPGLSSYMTKLSGSDTVNLPFQDNDAAPIQNISHLVWSEVTDLYGQGHSIIHSTNGFMLMDSDGVQVGSSEGGASSETWQLSVWGGDGSAYVATINSSNKVVVRRIDAIADAAGKPTEKWDTTDIADSLITVDSASNRPVRGMAARGDTLYLWVSDLAGGVAGGEDAIYRFDTATGKLRDGDNDEYWIRSFGYGAAGVGKFHKARSSASDNFGNLMSVARGRMALLNINFSGGDTGSDNITTGLAHSTGAAGVETALEALSGISSGDVDVTGVSAKHEDGLLVEFKGVHANRNVPQLSISTASTAQIATVACVRDTGDNLNGKYFLIYDGKGQKYMVWFKTGASETAVTKVSDVYKAIKVTVATDAANTVVAAAVQVALHAEDEFTATVATATVTVTAVTAATTTAPAAGDSGFTVAVDTAGVSGLTGPDEVQVLRMNGSPTHGTTTLSLEHGGGTQTTGAIPYDSTAAVIQGHLEGLSNVTGPVTEKWSLQSGPDGSSEHTYIVVVAEVTTLHANIDNTQTTLQVAASSGTRFDLNKEYGTTIGIDRRQIVIGDEAMLVTNVNTGTTPPTLTVVRGSAQQWQTGTLAHGDSEVYAATVAQPHSAGAKVYHRQTTEGGVDGADSAAAVKTAMHLTPASEGFNFWGGGPTNEKQDVTISGASAGTFQLEFRGVRSGNIAFNAASSVVHDALEAMSNIGSGQITATGGALNSSAVQIEFTGTLASKPLPLMKIVVETGLDASTKTVTRDTAGVEDDLTTTGTALNDTGDPVVVEFGGYWADKSIYAVGIHDMNASNPWEGHVITQTRAQVDSAITVTGGWDSGSPPTTTVTFSGGMAATAINTFTATESLEGGGDEEVKVVKSTVGGAVSSTVTTVVQGTSNYTEKQKVLIVAGGGEYKLSFNAENTLQILDINTAETLASTPLQAYGTSLNYGLDIDVDPSGNFYFITAIYDGSTYTFATQSADNNGTIRWVISATGTTRSIAYDAINDRVAVCGLNCAGTHASFVLLNAATGAIILQDNPYFNTIDPDTGSSYGIDNWNEIQVTHKGALLLFRNQNADNIIKLSSATTPVETWIKTLGINKMVGASTAAVYALNPENSLATRQIQSLAVSGGRVKEFRPTAQFQAEPVDRWVELENDSGGANGAAPPLRADVPVFSAQLGNNIFYVDGTNYKYFDPDDDELKTWTAAEGTLPSDSAGNTARLICLYHGRIVLAGIPGDPANFFMSAAGDAFDFDYGATPQTETMAVAGGASPAGKAPDKINTFIPMTDNVLIVGCDHSVYAIMGDIAAEGGRIDMLTEEVGLAWGMGSWCKDPYGTFYAFGSRGGIYAGVLGGQVTKISTPAIEERMATTVNMNTDLVNMVWNEREQGFHVFVSSLQLGLDTNTPATTTNYFYDTRNQSWWVDTFANTKHQPTSVHIFDGDAPDDRSILLGGWDGVIRKWDPDSATDGNVTGDTTSISSHVYLGPFVSGPMANVRLEEMQPVIAEGSGDVSYAVYVGDSPHKAYNQSTSRYTGTWSANRNKSERRAATGAAIYLKMSNSAATAWAMEGLRCQYREVLGPRVTRRV